MADFPAIEPTTREFDFGDFPMSKAAAFAGGEVRFSHGDEAISHDLVLGFADLSNAEMASIRSHYRTQQGGFLSFVLPAVIWQGHTTSSDIVPITGRWKYAGPPDETHKAGRLYDVSVTLQYVGLETAFSIG